MASTRSQKSRALQEVEQELQEFEHLSQLMEQTGLGNPVSQNLAEKPRKTTKRKAEKTEKSPAAIPSAMRAANNEMEMELLWNQNHKLELEILDKKLQLQNLMQISPEAVHPIESTPLKGGLLDLADNNQEFPRDFPTLDALRVR